MLHELAHIWLESRLDAADRGWYLEPTGLSTWLGAEAIWSERGGERAAEVLMWGLLDVDIPLAEARHTRCDVLVQEFRSLTSADPLAALCRLRGVTPGSRSW